jgi:predicted TIM-barrel fold metal-dependent hydrolase
LNQGVRVARIFPPYYHATAVGEWAAGELFRALEAHRLPLMIAGSELGKHPDDTRPGYSAQNVYDICQAHPQLPVVVVHLNWSATRILHPLMHSCSNLFVEISYYSTHRGVEFLARQFGADRILFGTGMPETSPGVGLALVLYAGVSDEERRLIAGDNLRRLLADVR